MGDTLNILIDIVDDNHEDADLIKMYLRREIKNDTRIFDDPEMFLNLPAEEMNLCIIDFRFTNSDKTGFDIAKKVKKKNSGCYIIMVTGYSDANELRKCWNIGVKKCLDKNDKDFKIDLVESVQEGLSVVTKDMMLKDFIKTTQETK